MDKTQQIEKIARILCGDENNECDGCQHCTLLTSCSATEDATKIYNAGYRKFNNNIDFYTIEKAYNDYMNYDGYVVITPTINRHSFRTEAEAEKFLADLKDRNII